MGIRRIAIGASGRRLLARLRRPGQKSDPRPAGAATRPAESLRQALAELEVPVRNIFLIAGRNAAGLARALASCAPTATVHLVAPLGLPDSGRERLPATVRLHDLHEGRDLHQILLSIPQPELIIDARARTDRQAVERLRRMLLFVSPGGAYAIRLAGQGRVPSEDRAAGVVTALDEFVAQHRERKSARTSHAGEVSAACAGRSICGDVVVVRKQFAHRYKIRDRDANAILNARFGSEWGEVVTTRPAEAYTSRAIFVQHGTHGAWHGQGSPPTQGARIEVPELHLRRYDDVTAWYEQRLARDGFWLPDTFRHPLSGALTHRRLVGGISPHGRLPEGSGEEPRPLAGSFFYFDTEHPGHFGHVLTEVVSRYWGWQRARAHDPSVRPLLSAVQGEHALPGFQQQIFEALGVPVSRAEFIAPNECVQVESLYAATPMFEMPYYAASDLADVWATIARLRKRHNVATPRRLFVTRRKTPIRTCLNSEEVEEFFSNLGFTVFHPELHDFADQVTAFAQADVVAGYAGSGMFSMMYAPSATVLLISAETYTATNEFLIASVLGTRLHDFLAESEIQHPPGRWAWAAYQSNFRFDLARFGAEIRAVVEDAPSY